MFGAPKPNTMGFGSLGSTLSNTTPGLQLGQQTAPSLSFGAPAPNVSVTSGSLSFGATSTTSSGFNFGQSAGTSNFSGGSVTLGAQTGFGGFGQPTSTANPLQLGTSFGIAKPTAQATVSSSAATAAPSLGGSTLFTGPAPSTGFSFGAKTTASSLGAASTPGFSFASTSLAPTLGTNLAASTGNTGLNFGGGLFATASTAPAVSTVATASVGLGGVDSANTKLGLAGTGVAEPKHVKDFQLPDPILATFTGFQTFIKEQKALSVDIAHSSSKPMKKVQEDIDAMESLLANVTSGLARNSVATEKLKGETAQELFYADMAQRAREVPSSLSYEMGPDQYFADLVGRFETDAERLKVQVEAAGRHLRSITQSSALSPQELTLAMRRLHDSLVVLAARVQSLHVAKQSAQEEYRLLRHVYLKEDLPVVTKVTPTSRKSAQRSLAGPTPFSETSGIATLSVDALSMLTGGAPSAIPPSTTTQGWLTPGTALMATPPSSYLSSPVDNSGFQLSKPPVGSKRNKR